MTDSLPSDDVASLARRLAEQIAALCPHIPADELTDLSSRLAFKELAHATGVALERDEPQSAAVVPLGNRVVWLPGASASAIVLPAGEEQPRAAEAAARILAWTRRHGALISGIAARGSAALREIGPVRTHIFRRRTTTVPGRTS